MKNPIPSIFVIAEAGVNHNGSVQRALDLCSIARDCGADAVKFQTWKTDLLVLPFTPQADYQKRNGSDAQDQYSMLRELELSYSDFERIKLHCDSIGIEFLSTPDEVESLRFLVHGLGLKTIKVGSGELGNLPFLREATALSEHVILSTGMSSFDDVMMTINALGNPDPESLTLLHCTSSYPCPAQYANLRVIPELISCLPYDIGYSDHTLGIAVSLAATALGAKVIEKHFTQSSALPGPDHSCSLEPVELAKLVEGIRTVSTALGSKQKDLQVVEEDVRLAVTKIIIATKTIHKGMLFSPENITLIRTGDIGISGFGWDSLLGRQAMRSYRAYEPIDPLETIKI